MKTSLPLSRRNFFRTLSGLAGVLSTRAADRPKQGMIVRSVRPEDFDMPLEGFDTWITPIEHFFVRSHMSKPSVDLAAWRLSVQGEVSSPLNLTMDELKTLPAAEVVSVLECAGNGRGFYQPTITGMPRSRGGVRNARSRGVRLGEVLTT